ncbi:RidA family protein [Fulvivirga lutimaris]|uniref:RidA family protein n=1 Tax=Fulvivirga lutimaris TaxID=1819566 RepID=UPI0012BC5DB0|nr:RidA family protein [Fulvivirga lutimaris]MTI41937.1 RidA family protein [Fulvivirga lutimaris]
MTNRVNISSGAEWENVVGYSRAVKIGNHIEVSGTVALKEGELVGAGNAYVQTKRCLEIIEESLEKLEAKMENVIRTRIYVTNIEQWHDIGKAHGEFFLDIKPATSMVEVSKLISPEYLVEIEATAIVQ